MISANICTHTARVALRRPSVTRLFSNTSGEMTNHTDIGTETLEEHCCHGWSCQNQSEQPFAQLHQLHQLHQLRIDPLLTMYSGPSIPLRTLNVQAVAAKRTSIAIVIGVTNARTARENKISIPHGRHRWNKGFA